MKIQAAQMQLASQHQAQSRHQVSERLTLQSEAPPRPEVELSAAALTPPEAAPGFDLRASLEGHPLWGLVKALIQQISGEQLDILDIVPCQACNTPAQTAEPPNAVASEAQWQIEYEYHEEIHETELTQFTASGIIQTHDGRNIEFSAQLELYREYHEVSNVALSMGQATVRKDPLVLNLNAPSAQLNSRTMQFDLDGDGQQENIATLAEGSAYLALDHNGDGQINNGSELFGTQSGNGFADLAKFDADHNGWIDENDPVWARLKLWHFDSVGQAQLISLEKFQVGAIYLQSAETEFAIRDNQNNSLGEVRKSGVFIHEDGKVGTAQQIDLLV